MGRRAWGTVAAASTVVIGLSACGGGSGSDNGNGVAARSPGQIIGAAISAAQGAGSVRVTGTTSGNNIEIVKGKGATGAISISGEKVRVVVTDSAAYLNGNRTFWQKTQPKAVALAGHWVRVPGAAATSQFKDITFPGLMSALAADKSKATKGDTTTISGQKAITLKLPSGGNLYVATTGKPYPVGSSGGQLGSTRFGDWGHSFTITPPKGAKSAAQLLGSG